MLSECTRCMDFRESSSRAYIVESRGRRQHETSNRGKSRGKTSERVGKEKVKCLKCGV